jgi:hypothetical protein
MMAVTEKERRREPWKLHLQSEHLSAIAHVAIRAAMLDKLIDMTAAQIKELYLPQVRESLNDFSTPKNLKLVKEALTLNMPQYRNALAEFVSEVDSARYERNDIIHAIWRPTDTPETHVIVELLEDGTEKVKRTVTAQRMMHLSNQLLDLMLELADWKMCSNAVLAQKPAELQDKPQQQYGPPTPPRTSRRD